MHERGRKRRQPVVLTICPAVVDHDILTLDKASFVQSLANDGDRMRIGSGRTAAKESNHRQPTLLRPCRERPSRSGPAEQGYHLSPSYVGHGLPLGTRSVPAYRTPRLPQKVPAGPWGRPEMF